MSQAERRAVLNVKRGLYTLTYRFDATFALLATSAPNARVEGASEGVYLVCAPGEEFGVLSRPGKGLVVLAETDGTLELVVRAAEGSKSLAAEFELTRVEAPRPVGQLREPPPRTPLPAGGAEFLVLAHVSLRGDVAAQRGNWICGPETPGRIEGFELRGEAGELPLEYQVATAGRTGGWSNWLSAGTYAGSRGKSMPLIGVRVRLKPTAAPTLALRADGLFLGAAATTRSGREIELVGPSPLDPLVGLRLDFIAVSQIAGQHPAADDGGQAKSASRMRVFRRTPRETEAA